MDWSLDEALDRLVKAVSVLSDDVQRAAHLSEHSDTPFSRRTFVRAVLAQFEGTLNLLGNFALEAQADEAIDLSERDVQFLKGEKTTRAGSASVVFIPILERVGPVFNSYSRVYGKSFPIDKGGQGWAKLRLSIELRNRLSHPKNAGSFSVSDAELDDLKQARKWFAGNIRSILGNFETFDDLPVAP